MGHALTRSAVAAMIDHTLLKPEATPDDVAQLLADAQRWGVKAVCISPSMLPVSFPHTDGEPSPLVATVVGFPSGKHHSLLKAAEARFATECGAVEIDMVIDVGAAVAGNYSAVVSDIVSVQEAIADRAILKVIIESAALAAHAPDPDAAIVETCRAAMTAGAQFVKTSTGFHPAGGATTHAVALMAETVGSKLGVKASGGIRTAADALAMIDAGATRLGLSATGAILDQLSDVDKH